MATTRRTDARGEPPCLKRSQAAVAEAKKAWREDLNKRLQACLAKPVPLMPNDIFTQALETSQQGETLRQEILAPAPQAQKPPRRTKAPKGLPPYLAALYDTPLLTREQEAHLFRKMNFLKSWANKIRDDIKPYTAGVGAKLRQFEALISEAAQIRSAIVKANLRLVVSIAKRYNTHGDQNRFFEMVSDGNMSLFQAVEKFDYARGNKFSTYASWAIAKNYGYAYGKEKERETHFLPHHKVMGNDDGDSYTWEETIADTRTDETAAEAQTQLSHDLVKKILESANLTYREQLIVTARFGLNGCTELTLEKLGGQFGITKERVRQIQERALEKLLRTASAGDLLHSGSFGELEVVEC